MGNRKWTCQRLHRLLPKWEGVTLACLRALSSPQCYLLSFMSLHHFHPCIPDRRCSDCFKSDVSQHNSSFLRDHRQCAGVARHVQSRINLHTLKGEMKHWRQHLKIVNSLQILSHTQTNRMVYAREIRFLYDSIVRGNHFPNLIRRETAQQCISKVSFYYWMFCFCCLAAEIHQDSNTSLERTDNTVSVAPGVLEFCTITLFSLFLGLVDMCISKRYVRNNWYVCVCVCIQICR